jgi:L-malate glycosyltransferase
MNKNKILHIASHYGGGVGTTIKALIENDTENSHKLTYLNDIPDQTGELFNPDMINDCDFAIVHVWNHPALWDFIVNTQLPPCRLIGWSHMSGLHAPYLLFDKLVDYFDEFFFTSPVSNLTGIKKDYIWSACSIDKFVNLPKKGHRGFNIGYIGTLDFCKIHPEFINICSQINIPDVRFTVVGEGCDSETLKKQAKEKNLNMEFTGLVKDVKPYLAEFDIFLYPLYEKHFGTCEQILGEALASGLPCFVLNNPAENYIIEHLWNGFIGKDTIDLINNIHRMYNFYTKMMILQITDRSKESAITMYSFKKTVSRWNEVFSKEILRDKRLRSWDGGNDPFIESLGNDGACFQKYINSDKIGDIYRRDMFAVPAIKKLFSENYQQWSSENKGSIKQYLNYFPDNKYLKEWLKLL